MFLEVLCLLDGSRCLLVVEFRLVEFASLDARFEKIVNIREGSALGLWNNEERDDESECAQSSEEEADLAAPVELVRVVHVRREEVECPHGDGLGSEASSGCLGPKAHRRYFRHENWNGTGNTEAVEEADDDHCCAHSPGRLSVRLHAESLPIGDVPASRVSAEASCNSHGGPGHAVEEETDEDHSATSIPRDRIPGDHVGEHIRGDADDVNHK